MWNQSLKRVTWYLNLTLEEVLSGLSMVMISAVTVNKGTIRYITPCGKLSVDHHHLLPLLDLLHHHHLQIHHQIVLAARNITHIHSVTSIGGVSLMKPILKNVPLVLFG